MAGRSPSSTVPTLQNYHTLSDRAHTHHNIASTLQKAEVSVDTLIVDPSETVAAPIFTPYDTGIRGLGSLVKVSLDEATTPLVIPIPSALYVVKEPDVNPAEIFHA
jgi:hypothetical protein